MPSGSTKRRRPARLALSTVSASAANTPRAHKPAASKPAQSAPTFAPTDAAAVDGMALPELRTALAARGISTDGDTPALQVREIPSPRSTLA